MNRFEHVLSRHGLSLRRAEPEILQLNLGKLCNLTCTHCHVNAGPKRREIISRETADAVLDWFAATTIPTLDLTGGAPEMVPDFRRIVARARALTPRRRIIDRCNLTILLAPEHDGLAEFLVENEVEIIASMPCYSPENVNAQRGEGVFDASIAALQLLNRLGYGRRPELPLHLVYNPNGAFLPGPQAELAADYKRELRRALRHCLQSTSTPSRTCRSRASPARCATKESMRRISNCSSPRSTPPRSTA